MFDPIIITTSDQLQNFCQKFRQDCLTLPRAFMTVDTEFVRRSTYWAKLALIQIASPTMVGLIDVLSPSIVLDDLKNLLIDPQILKVFHSSRQDFEVLWQAFGLLPNPFYDTQVAAMGLGFGDSIGYEALVNHYLKIKLDKTQQFTNWVTRPLTEQQVQYAAEDVVYLRTIYEKIQEQLKLQGRSDWIKEDMMTLSNPDLYVIEPQDAWKRLKLRSVGKKIDLTKLTAFLQKLAAWREEQAQQHNVPRTRILKDENIIDTALNLTQGTLSFKKIDNSLFKKNEIFVPLDHFSYQKLKDSLYQISNSFFKTDILYTVKKPLNSNLEPLFDLLCLFLKHRADQLGIVSKLLTTPAEIEQFLTKDLYTPNFFQGWRWDHFGREAKGLKEGKIALYFDTYLKTTPSC